MTTKVRAIARAEDGRDRQWRAGPMSSIDSRPES
jgi:hypothetical protein